MKIALNECVLRQTKQSKFSHFEGSWEELVKLVEDNFDKAKPGYRDGVCLVPVPPDRFMSSVINISKGMRDGEIKNIKAVYKPRFEGEDPVIQIVASGNKGHAKCVNIVLYNHETLQEGDEATTGADWEILSINASPTKEEVPMGSTTRARNILVEHGGTNPNLENKSKDELIQFIRDGARASMFWSRHIMVEPETEDKIRPLSPTHDHSMSGSDVIDFFNKKGFNIQEDLCNNVDYLLGMAFNYKIPLTYFPDNDTFEVSPDYFSL